MAQTDIENLFLQGGSVKGTAYIGAVRALLQHLNYAQVKRLAGTSAGSIGAALLAVGFSVDDLEETLRNLEFDHFLDGPKDIILKAKDTPTAAGTISTLFSHPFAGASASSDLHQSFGLCPGEFFREWIEKKITCKIKGVSESDYDKNPDPAYLTFQELHELAESNPNYKDLYVITLNVTTGEAEFLSYETAPDVIISDAVRCSMSIPIVFYPHKLYRKSPTGARILKAQDEDMDYTDGGLTDNYRVTLFDKPRYIRDFDPDAAASAADESQTVYNPRTLGLKLASSDKKGYYEGTADKGQPKAFKQFIPFLMGMVKAMHHKQNLDFMDAGDKRRTIIIDTLDVDTLDFNLSDLKKDALIASGEAAVEAFFQAEDVIENNADGRSSPQLSTV